MADDIEEPRRWRRDGWTAKVVQSEDPEGGWAVEMWRAGDPEPALIGPWTMGRDKKNPKPLDGAAFRTLVKTASDVLARHAQQARRAVHQEFRYVDAQGRRIGASYDLVPDDDDPHAWLACVDDVTAEPIAEGRVPVGFKLSSATIEAFIVGNRGR
jgi:hypothetical protein